MARLIYLASSSPRRRELLGIAGFMFSTIKVDVDESVYPNEFPPEYTQRVSLMKAEAAERLIKGDPLILSADTTVADGTQMLGKPLNAQEAEQMLKRLRGRTHQVYTAVTVLDVATGRIEQEVAETDVPMRNYTDTEILTYITSGDPFDKAGGYAIQNSAFHPVKTRTGCYANVIGLPLCHLLKILRRIDIPVEQDIPYLCQTAHDYKCGVFTSILRNHTSGE
ncbi:MAG: septum formation protein Maf [Anaerolineae bacterium]|nr:MAG: septum formation protein Maf [Anaerolineae bacterium]